LEILETNCTDISQLSAGYCHFGLLVVGGKSCLSRVCPRCKQIDVWFSQRGSFLLLMMMS